EVSDRGGAAIDLGALHGGCIEEPNSWRTVVLELHHDGLVLRRTGLPRENPCYAGASRQGGSGDVRPASRFLVRGLNDAAGLPDPVDVRDPRSLRVTVDHLDAVASPPGEVLDVHRLRGCGAVRVGHGVHQVSTRRAGLLVELGELLVS